jgi:hypothetical protein
MYTIALAYHLFLSPHLLMLFFSYIKDSKMKLLFALLLVSIASPSLCSNTSNTFDIVKYGAKGDGHTDDSNVYYFIVIIFFH